jgi:hypothetical protein
MRNTIQKVTMVVPVLMTSCQESLNRNRGPDTNHTTTTPTAARKATGLPVTRDVAFAK